MLRNLECKRVQVDEIWGFVGCKEAQRYAQKEDEAKLATFGFGSRPTQIRSLSPTGTLVRATCNSCYVFMRRSAARITGRFQLTTDGFVPYREAVDVVFGARSTTAS